MMRIAETCENSEPHLKEAQPLQAVDGVSITSSEATLDHRPERARSALHCACDAAPHHCAAERFTSFELIVRSNS